MKQITLSTGEWLFVVVPKDAIRFWLHLNTVCYGTKTGFGEAYNAGEIFTERQKLESLECTHEIIGKAIELSEEQARGIVEEKWGGFAGHIHGYKNYNRKFMSMDEPPEKTAKESLHTLIQSLSLEAESTLILKKQ